MQILGIVPPLTLLFSAFNFINNVHNENKEVRDFEDEDSYRNTSMNNDNTNSTRNFLGLTRVLSTTSGKIRGTRHLSRIGKIYFNFRGIPYAKAPVENLRFEAPVAHPGWKGVLEAFSYSHQCLQVIMATKVVIGSEDCLFLNVATRSLPKTGSENKLLPVIVYIHGGLFMFSGSTPFRPKYFMDEDVILVTLNYRLASFGFLNTGDGMISGNMGMKDQIMALKWVRDNIKYFGGDPQKVTILGESAGGASVHLHTMSPLSKGLFSRAISLSGTALSPWTIVTEPDLQAEELAEGVGCPIWNSPAMVFCLKSLPAKTLAKYHAHAVTAFTHGRNSLFGPTVETSSENAFLPDSPGELMRQGKISKVPWMTGVTSGEGLIYLIALLRNTTLAQHINKDWDSFAPVLLGYEKYNKRFDLSAALKEFYLDNTPLSLSNSKQAVHMLSDRGFFLDHHDAAILHSRVAPTYAYYYNYRGVFGLGNLLFYKAPVPFLPTDQQYAVGTGLQWIIAHVLNKRRKGNNQIVDLGVCHGDELPLLFNMPVLRREVTRYDPDFAFSRKLIRLLVTFAERGTPDLTQVGEHNTVWDTVRAQNPRYQDIALKRLHIDESFSIIKEPFYERLQFWKNHSFSHL